MTTFRVATFVNDEDQYREMRLSFEAAGFVSPLARFTVEKGEPYGGVSRLGQAEEPYVMLVHQDVRCDWGDTVDLLLTRLAELSQVDPSWTIAGNAGRCLDSPLPEGEGCRLVPIRHISDPHGTDWAASLPTEVVSLDENVLILRTERAPKCSSGLSGWHLYGADAALNAAAAGGSAYVIDFRLTHLSGGTTNDYEACRRRFIEHWRGVDRTDEPRTPRALTSVASALTALERLDRAGGHDE